MWQNLYQGFSELSKAEQLELFKEIKILLFREEQRDIVMLIDDIRESRFSEGLGCLHCDSTTVKKNGKYLGRQRYLCKDCGKTFNDNTNTPLSGTRYPSKCARIL